MIAGLSNRALYDLCRQVGIQFTYRYVNANGRKSRLFQDRSYLTHQIVKKGQTPAQPAPTPQNTPTPDEAPTDEAPTPDEVPTDAPTDEAPTDVSDVAQAALTSDTDLHRKRLVATVNDWVDKVQAFRDAAERRGLKVLIGSRQSQRGSLMLSKGMDVATVAALEIANRMNRNDWINLQNEANIRIGDPTPHKRTRLNHRKTELLKALIALRIHVWLHGPPSSGKSTIADKIATALGLPFYFTGAIDNEFKLAGFVDAQGRIVNTQFRRAFTEGGVFLFDEIDRSLPNAVLPFNGMLANGWGDFPGNSERVYAHKDFVCLVGANTNGSGGTELISGAYKQDAAFCDRFAMLDFPIDRDLEREIALSVAGVL